jgi:hypothetical protein
MFSDINFKYTDASEEALYAPELIDGAYVDVGNILDEIESPQKFLVVGPKGAGKSALSSKLKRASIGVWNKFVETDELEQFEFKLLEKTGGERGTSIGGAVTVWQLLLFIRIISLLLKDKLFEIKNPSLVNLSNRLKTHGLSPSESLVALVQQTSRKGAFVSFKALFGEFRGDAGSDASSKIKDPAAILDAIKDAFLAVEPSDSSFSLILDGLDHPIKSGRSNAVYLGDLINATRSTNAYFIERKIKAKVIILIRDEVLSVIPDPNLTKRVVDNGIVLKWYDNTRSPFETSLMKVVESRAHLAGIEGDIQELWSQWFPEVIDHRDSVTFILDNTRYLPRDLISFFRSAQELGSQPPFNRNKVLAALGNYSEWFLSELSDALVGFVAEEVRSELPGILNELGRRFTFEELERKLVERKLNEKQPTEQLAKDLFNTCWIGNVWKTEEGTDRYSWKYRKRNAAFNKTYQMIIHAGLWKALNLV